MVTTVTLSPRTRDRLKRYGTAGMTYDAILQAMMDRIDEEDFVLDVRRKAAAADDADAWVDLDEA